MSPGRGLSNASRARSQSRVRGSGRVGAVDTCSGLCNSLGSHTPEWPTASPDADGPHRRPSPRLPGPWVWGTAAPCSGGQEMAPGTVNLPPSLLDPGRDQAPVQCRWILTPGPRATPGPPQSFLVWLVSQFWLGVEESWLREVT